MSNTTGVLPPPHPPLDNIEISRTINKDPKDNSAFYNGEMVLMRGKRISKEEVKRFYDIYNDKLPIETWWSYLGKDSYNRQIEYCKDSDDEYAYYVFHTKYIGRVTGRSNIKKFEHGQGELYQPMYTVEWEAREGMLMPGESWTRTQEHYPENLLSLSKMTIMNPSEIVRDALQQYLLDSESGSSIAATNNL